MTGEEALRDYGYAESDGMFIRKGTNPTQAWSRDPDSDGWFRYDPPALAGTAFSGDSIADPSGGAQWGIPVDGTFWVRAPYRQSARFATASGLHPLTHPECFDWVWPDYVVAELYQHAARLTTDADGVSVVANPVRRVTAHCTCVSGEGNTANPRCVTCNGTGVLSTYLEAVV